MGKTYLGKVANTADFGVFVNLNAQTKGLIHSSNVHRAYVSGEEVMVKINSIKPNGNFDLIPHNVKDFKIIEVEKNLPRTKSGEINKYVNKHGQHQRRGRADQADQRADHLRGHGRGRLGLVRRVRGSGHAGFPRGPAGGHGPGHRRDYHAQQRPAARSPGHEEADGRRRRGDQERHRGGHRQPGAPQHVDFLVQSEVLEKLRPQMEKVAMHIRRAILKSVPIIIRHHADADGICAGVAVERACLPLIRQEGDSEAEYHFFGRSPSKAPFYELEDVNKDLVMALEDSERHGQRMPLIVLMDNGSTEEDIEAYRYTQVYGLDLLVVDHHHPDATVDPFLKGHVNPYHAGGDFGITAGMLGVELARMINPDVTDEIKHMAAVAAVGDRSEAPERAKYLALVKDKYSEDELKKIALALDFEQFWLRYNDGRGIINDILNLGGSSRHRAIVDLLCDQANKMIIGPARRVHAPREECTAANGAILHIIDVENFAHKFTFPAPGKTTGEIHDLLCRKNEGQPVVTLGYGPDFAVLRSRGVQMNIPRMVRELRDEIKGGGVNGGGHLVVGSIKFVEGMRKEVLEKLSTKIGQYPADMKPVEAKPPETKTP